MKKIYIYMVKVSICMAAICQICPVRSADILRLFVPGDSDVQRWQWAQSRVHVLCDATKGEILSLLGRGRVAKSKVDGDEDEVWIYSIAANENNQNGEQDQYELCIRFNADKVSSIEFRKQSILLLPPLAR